MDRWYTYVNIRPSIHYKHLWEAQAGNRWEVDKSTLARLRSRRSATADYLGRAHNVLRSRSSNCVLPPEEDLTCHEAIAGWLFTGGIRRSPETPEARKNSELRGQENNEKQVPPKQQTAAGSSPQKEKRREKDREKRGREMKTPEIPGMFRHIYICFIACKYTYIFLPIRF